MIYVLIIQKQYINNLIEMPVLLYLINFQNFIDRVGNAAKMTCN